MSASPVVDSAEALRREGWLEVGTDDMVVVVRSGRNPEPGFVASRAAGLEHGNIAGQVADRGEHAR